MTSYEKKVKVKSMYNLQSTMYSYNTKTRNKVQFVVDNVQQLKVYS